MAVEPLIPCGQCEACRAGQSTRCSGWGRVYSYGLLGIDIEPSLLGGYAEYMYLHPNTTLHRVASKLPARVGDPAPGGGRSAVRADAHRDLRPIRGRGGDSSPGRPLRASGCNSRRDRPYPLTGVGGPGSVLRSRNSRNKRHHGSFTHCAHCFQGRPAMALVEDERVAANLITSPNWAPIDNLNRRTGGHRFDSLPEGHGLEEGLQGYRTVRNRRAEGRQCGDRGIDMERVPVFREVGVGVDEVLGDRVAD